MSLPETVSRYVAARLAADGGAIWERAPLERAAFDRLRELLAACFGEGVAVDAALIDHAPDYVRQQAERWRGMVARIPLPPHVQVYRLEHVPPRPQHMETALHGAVVIVVDDFRWYVWEVRGANQALVREGTGGLRGKDGVMAWIDSADLRTRDYGLISSRPSGVEREHFDAAVRRALRSIAEPAKEPEPIVVLGPWRQHPSGTWYRPYHGTITEGATVKHGGWALHRNRPFEAPLWPAIVRGDGGKDEADREARERGWVLLDAEPLPAPALLEPWETIACERRRYYCPREAGCVAIEVSQHGWRVRKPNGATLANGQQEGPEGERLAMAAAMALGFVEGA